MHNIKLCCGTLIVFASVLLSGCRQEPVLETTIPGLDLSKLQDQDYFRDRLEPTREFVAWCNKTMVEPIPEDKTSRLFFRNCKVASYASFLGEKRSLEATIKHERY